MTVKRRLTPRRRTRVVENDEFAGFFRRILLAFSRRIGRGDIEALAALWAMRAELDRELHTAVAELREHGYSWAEIGRRCDGMTKQAAQQRWSQHTSSAPRRSGNT